MRDITPSSLFATEAARLGARNSSVAAPERAASIDARGRVGARVPAQVNAHGGPL
ncbi:hypothetical protein, partial [Burkholderia pseudomallei]|uniref:hypothetical protein n=1 Tax=Burkholderia pseudomallei TaxID=28450 RepID=UPI0035A0E0EF